MAIDKGNWGRDGVRIYRTDALDADLAQALAAQRVAAMTHLPTGTPDSDGNHLVLPPGSPGITHGPDPGAWMIVLIRGELRLQWGRDFEHSGIAGPGTAVHVPPWVPVFETNGSDSEIAERLVVKIG